MFNLHLNTVLYFAVWSTCALANLKNCPDDCVDYGSCPIAQTLLNKRDGAADAKLSSQFCGRNPATGIPKVCCSKLRGDDDEQSPDVGSVEDHPNLRLLPDSCGPINGDKIVGGRTAGLYEYPWMVLISYYTGGAESGLEFKCSGSLINARYVLTAAHCVLNRHIAGVRVGDHNYQTSQDCQGEPPNLMCESRVQDFRVENIIPHPDYPSKQDDIALLRLKKPVNFDYRNAGTICLPVTRSLRSREIVGENATLAGWGFTEHGLLSTKLLTVDVPITSRETCHQYTKLHNRFKVTNREDENNKKICAGIVDKDSCDGDSGGPLMLKGAYRHSGQRYVAYGIVSYGPTHCGSGDPAVYTDVTKYLEWILDNMQL